MDQPSTTEVADRPVLEPSTPRSKAAGSSATPTPPVRVETPKTVSTDGARQIRGLRFAMGCAVAIGVTVILTAINVQSGRIVDREGHGWSFRVLFGPVFPGPNLFGSTNMQGWRVVTEAGQLADPERYAYLLRLFTAADLAFIIVYFFLLRAVITTVCRGRWRTFGRWALWALVGVDVVEDVLSWPGLFGPWPVGIVTVTALKWLAVVAVFGSVLLSVVTTPRRLDDERSVGARLRRTGKALMHQRFAFVPVLALFVLSVLSGAAVLEQLPDTLRRWIFDGRIGAVHAVLSIACTVALGLTLIVAGGYRSGYAFRHPKVEPPPEPTKDTESPMLWVWLGGPIVAVLGAAIVLVTPENDNDLLLMRFFAFLALPVVVILGSRLLRRRWTQHPDEYRYDLPPTFDERELTAVRLAGTIAGLGVIVVGGLSVLRAYVPLLLVPSTAPLGLIWLLLVIGGAAVVVPWVVAMAVVHRMAGRRAATLAAGGSYQLRTRKRPDRPVGSAVLLGVGIAIFVGLGYFPAVAGAIGLAATATLALGSIAVMLSGVALLIQDRPTAEIFRFLRLRRSPLVSLLALSLVLVSVFGGAASIHEVRSGSPSTTSDTRLSMEESFTAWLNSPERCVVTAGGRPVRPMLLIAAEGGGIRAAYWTVRSLQAIADTTCGERSALFSAGASGGSVGLTVARFSGTPESPNSQAAVDAVKRMAAPEILSRATDGTFVRDILYGASGVPLQRWTEPDYHLWKDRARLIEDGWADRPSVDGLDWGDRDFLTPPQQLSPVTGQLILNSTDVKHACRVWVSQVSPGLPVTETDARSFDPEQSCDKSPGPGARTVDLFSAYGPFAPDTQPGSCLGRIRAATAALLTARFPYVTPSGVVGPCPPVQSEEGKSLPYWPRTQLVDGGYIENSGLATLTDLSDDWLREVRTHNAAILAQPSATEPLVVPVVVFLANGDREVVQPAIDTSPVSELALPVLTYLRGGNSLDGNDALLERGRAAVELDGFCPDTASACTELQNHFPSRVVVVDRVTQPEIGAPLGWVMSQASIDSMEEALIKGQLGTTCTANTPRTSGGSAPVQADRETQPSCRTAYATLGDLVRYYNSRT